MRDPELLREMRCCQGLVVGDNHLWTSHLRDRPAVLEHSPDHGKDVVTKRGSPALGFGHERPEVGVDRCELDLVGGTEPCEGGISRERDVMAALGEVCRKRREWLDIPVLPAVSTMILAISAIVNELIPSPREATSDRMSSVLWTRST